MDAVKQTPVKAGFPNPAEEANLAGLSLHDLVIKRPASTFFMRVSGQIQIWGIFKNDLLIIDKSLDPQPGDLVVAWHNGEFKIGQVGVKGSVRALLSSQGEVLADTISGQDLQIWGVITYNLHSHKGSHR